MRKQETESYDEWVIRVKDYEYSLALKRINSKEDVNLVLEEMSVKLTAKLLHPLIDNLKKIPYNNYDSKKSWLSYKKNYLNKTNKIADHMNDVE